MNIKHTATPWECEFDGPPYRIYHVEGGLNAQIAYVDGVTQHGDIAKANAAYICRACNSHEALVEALKHCVEALEYWFNRYGDTEGLNSPMLAHAREALKLAEEE